MSHPGIQGIWLAALIVLVGAACSPVPQSVVLADLPTASPEPERTSIILHGATSTAPPPPTVTQSPTITAAPLPTEEAPPGDLEGSDLPDYYGGLVITLDYVGQTIFMKRGQGFLFQLGDSYDWEINVDPPEVLTINQRYVPLEGEQGVYIAREKGKATVKAVGSPRCLLNSPPCARPNVLFTLHVEVE